MKVIRHLSEIIGIFALATNHHAALGRLVGDKEVTKHNDFVVTNDRDDLKEQEVPQRNLIAPPPPDWRDGCQGSVLGVRQRLYRNEYLCLYDDRVGATYGFGLDEDGVLRERRQYDNYQGMVWSSGYSGEFLAMQSDGNLVLYEDNDGTAVWATDCFASGATLMVSDAEFEHGFAAVMTPDGQTVWRIYPGGVESSCYPTAAPPVICKGTTLEATEKLRRNEYLCSPDNRSRFGLNDRGQLILNHRWQRMANVWSPGAWVTGDHLIQQKSDGNLVLYKDDGTAPWASACMRTGAALYMSNYRLYSMLGELGDILWYFDYLNPVLQCQEDLYEPCTKAAVVGSTCRMHMIDHQCRDYVSAQVLELGNNKFNFTVGEQTFCWKEFVGGYQMDVTSDGMVGHWWTCDEILSETHEDIYLLQEKSDHLEFHYDAQYPCTRFGKNLIYHGLVEYWYD